MDKVQLLSEEILKEGMKTAWAGHPVIFKEELDSTNRLLMALGAEGASHGTLAVTELQTAGRGRRGRSWYSPKGSGIWMSILLRPKLPAEKTPMLTLAAAMAAYDALKPYAKDCAIKWPNDLVINGKKVCGILTEGVTGLESRTIDYIIIGIGINCHPADLTENAGEKAGDLGGGFSRSELAAQVANELIPLLKDLDPAVFLDYYREHSNVIGENIRIFGSGIASRPGGSAEKAGGSNKQAGGSAKQADGSAEKAGSAGQPVGIPAKAIGIAANGGLEVEYSDGRRDVLTSGEITIRKDNSR